MATFEYTDKSGQGYNPMIFAERTAEYGHVMTAELIRSLWIDLNEAVTIARQAVTDRELTTHRLRARIRELDAACALKDWNPSHFLDTAEMSTAVAIVADTSRIRVSDG